MDRLQVLEQVIKETHKEESSHTVVAAVMALQIQDIKHSHRLDLLLTAAVARILAHKDQAIDHEPLSTDMDKLQATHKATSAVEWQVDNMVVVASDTKMVAIMIAQDMKLIHMGDTEMRVDALSAPVVIQMAPHNRGFQLHTTRLYHRSQMIR